MAHQLTRLKLFTFLCFSVCLLVLLIPADARAQQDWNIASQAISSSEAANDPHESEGDQESSDAPTVLSPDRSENDAAEGASDSARSPAPTRDSVSISLRTAIFAGSFESSSLGLADGVVLAPHVHAQYQHRLGLRLIAGAHLLLAPSLTETPIMGDETNSLHLVVGNPYIGASHWWGSMRVGGVLFVQLGF